MKRAELFKIRQEWLNKNVPYKCLHYTDFDYNILSNIMYIKRAGRGDNSSYNDVIIMIDTETSKKNASVIGENHVVAWTISIRAFNRNIVTLWGRKPSSMISCMTKIHESMSGDKTIFYCQNFPYDWVFLEKFIFPVWGHPDHQLNVKSHYPIFCNFNNGIIIKDSLILFQRKLEKVAIDLDVEHKKAVGKWDYDKLRGQQEEFTDDEIEYIEHDTLAGVECIQKYMDNLHKHIYSMPYTATGIPREEVRKRGQEHHAHDNFVKMCPDFVHQCILELVYHGGCTHANRHYIDQLINKKLLEFVLEEEIEDDKAYVQCYDFASSYPFVMLSEKYPMEKFTEYDDCSIDEILSNKEDYAFYFKLTLIKPRLKNDSIAMPALQYSKCVKVLNPVLDNGRILCAELAQIYLTETDLEVIAEQYDYNKHLCSEVMVAAKDYLPRWFTDYVFECFEAKTKLKSGDKVLYALAKAKLNSLYGMCVQKPVKETINENYLSGDYEVEQCDMEELYNKYINKRSSVLPYQWGVWVTAYAFRNLFKLGKCCRLWFYSDTDSCYGYGWNEEAVNAYNDECIEKLKRNNYGGVYHNGRFYYLGVAETEGDSDRYTEFKVQGAKRYAGRNKADGELHITVAGVPKKGAMCLNNDLNNFKAGLIFNGTATGKKTHTYFYVNEVYQDENGNETGNSIDLSPCDYLLDSVDSVNWEKIFEEEINIIDYEGA